MKSTAHRAALAALAAVLLNSAASSRDTVTLAAGHGEARVALDAKDAPVAEIVRVLAEAGRFQVVFDPGIDCKLTLKLHAAAWRSVLDTALTACGLGAEEEGDVMRVAPVTRLREEAAARRRLAEQQAAKPPSRLALFRLSYARAEQVAPLLERMLLPAGRVSYDSRSNTLIVSY